MGKYFSDAVDNAIEAIYYTYDRVTKQISRFKA